MTLKKKAIISIIFTTLVTTLLVSVYVYAVVYFVNQNQKNADNRTLIETENKRIYDVSMLKQQVLLAQNQQEKINQYFLKKDQIAPFLGFIESIGSETQSIVTIGSVDIAKGLKNSVLNVHFKVNGTYQQVMSAVQRIEQMPYYSRIQKIVLDIVPDSGGWDIVTIVGKDGKPVQTKTPKTLPLWSADITIQVYSFIDTSPVVNQPNK